MIRFTAHYSGHATRRAYAPGEAAALDAETERYLVETVQRAEYVADVTSAAAARKPSAGAVRIIGQAGSWYTLSDGRRVQGKAALEELGIQVP